MKVGMKNLTAVLQKGVLILLILTGCSSVKPISSMDPTVCFAKLAGKDVEIQRLKEEELFEEAMVEDEGRELASLRERVRRFVAYPHSCKHLGMLK